MQFYFSAFTVIIFFLSFLYLFRVFENILKPEYDSPELYITYSLRLYVTLNWLIKNFIGSMFWLQRTRQQIMSSLFDGSTMSIFLGKKWVIQRPMNYNP